ncbi:MAG: uroporphyrinogen-III C-methyltransferase [Gammaproteobacteria bacterium]|nr:uroporphyrinogen-III C-methyltransferase [Gammaproteobacteria bacterium]MBU1977723.1 uroporphyrinogen-III C-methyltransferase [Gammaproteobacteria bacterium]
MSENTQDRQEEMPVPAQTKPAPARVSRFNLGLAVGVVALVLIGWQWLDSRQHGNVLEQNLGRRLAESDSSNKESQIVAARAQEESRQAMVKLGMLEQKLAESQNQQVALESLYQELSRNRDEWVLAEIEQILLIASQQLQLAGNPKAALIALQTADSRLQRLDKPQFISLRKAIVADIERLQALPAIDVVGYSLRLDSLANMVDDLPLVIGSELQADRVTTKAGGDETPLAKLGREIWLDMKQLVRIQNMENPDAPLLSPPQAYFLRENLRLRFLSARIALLRHDEVTYKADLKAAEAWLRRYFDVKAKSTQTALGILKQLATGPLSIEMPDISTSLNAVRNNKLVRERSGIK